MATPQNSTRRAPRVSYNKGNSAVHWWALPFAKGAEGARGWALPLVGEYQDSNRAGNFAARAYLKHVYEQSEVRGGLGVTQHIVLAMIARAETTRTKRERAALRGQIVGFFSVLDWYLMRACAMYPDHFHNLTREEVLAGISDALAGGPTQRWEEKLRTERSNAARAAARARWARRDAARALQKAAAGIPEPRERRA